MKRAYLRCWHEACCLSGMMQRLKNLFTINTKFEAYLVIYALAMGAADRGVIYMLQYPGFMGKVLALCCSGAVFIAGGRLIDSVDMQAQLQA